jgi:hypothetical protein
VGIKELRNAIGDKDGDKDGDIGVKDGIGGRLRKY